MADPGPPFYDAALNLLDAELRTASVKEFGRAEPDRKLRVAMAMILELRGARSSQRIEPRS